MAWPLLLDVDKKSKVKIDQIYIVGNEAFGNNKLKGKMKKTNEKLRFHLFQEIFGTAVRATPKKAWNFLTKSHEVSTEELKEYLGDQVNVNFFKTSKYKGKEYKEDKKTLIAFYNSKGYRDAMILSDSISKANDKNINVHIHLEEGQKYYFRDIIWTGNFVHTDHTLNTILGVKKGDVYDMDLIQKKLTFNPNGPDISSLYMDNGYLFFNVDPVEVRVAFMIQ